MSSIFIYISVEVYQLDLPPQLITQNMQTCHIQDPPLLRSPPPHFPYQSIVPWITHENTQPCGCKAAWHFRSLQKLLHQGPNNTDPRKHVFLWFPLEGAALSPHIPGMKFGVDHFEVALIKIIHMLLFSFPSSLCLFTLSWLLLSPPASIPSHAIPFFFNLLSNHLSSPLSLWFTFPCRMVGLFPLLSPTSNSSHAFFTSTPAWQLTQISRADGLFMGDEDHPSLLSGLQSRTAFS